MFILYPLFVKLQDKLQQLKNKQKVSLKAYYYL